MRDVSRSLGVRAIERLPFTGLMLGAIVAVAAASGSAGAALPRMVVQRAGFAPRDLFDFDWDRVVNSALFTHGGLEFWAALAMIALAVGIAEWFAGTAFAAATFWGVHILTLVFESVFVALPLKLAGVGIGQQLVHVRDVGPSAGYVAALGAACALLPKPWRYAALPTVMLALVAITFAPSEPSLAAGAAWSAAIAHLIAFPLGWLALSVWRHLRRRDRSDAYENIRIRAEITPYTMTTARSQSRPSRRATPTPR